MDAGEESAQRGAMALLSGGGPLKGQLDEMTGAPQGAGVRWLSRASAPVAPAGNYQRRFPDRRWAHRRRSHQRRRQHNRAAGSGARRHTNGIAGRVISQRRLEPTIGCGVIVNGEVKVEKISDGVNDQTGCLVMSA